MEFYGEQLQNCACGKKHVFPLKEILSGKGVINRLPEILQKYGLKKPFIVADENTFAAAGRRATEILAKNGIQFTKFLFGAEQVEPDEKATERVYAAFDNSCDAVIGVGSGVINDICKLLSKKNDRFYIIIATAPSMDGYASATSSMSVNGLKTSLASKCADVIIGDVDVLKAAPLKMLKSGLGDMLAKYVSILEWRLSHEINGEYYCETVAGMIRAARDECVKNAAGLIERDERAVKAVFDGLIIGGIAMAYAGVSRPASGVEHYVSHVIDMRGLEFKTKTELHGIQCAIATLFVAKLYDKLKTVAISDEKGDRETHAFDKAAWKENLREFLGGAAEPMIALEEKEQKYDVVKAAARRKIIIEKWEKLKKIMDEELPSAKEIADILSITGIPETFEEAGLKVDMKRTFAATKDIRDKYVLSSLLWDLGLLGEFCDSLS